MDEGDQRARIISFQISLILSELCALSQQQRLNLESASDFTSSVSEMVKLHFPKHYLRWTIAILIPPLEPSAQMSSNYIQYRFNIQCKHIYKSN